jgi:protein-S-isoprenylcysteine O-methyltransferase Ste14
MAIPAGERSAGDIVNDAMRDFGEVVRAEIRLVRAEIGEKVQTTRKAAICLVAAALCGFLCAVCLAATCVGALAQVMPLWTAAALTALLLLGIGAGMYAGGRSLLRQVNPVPERTAQSVKESFECLRQLAK